MFAWGIVKAFAVTNKTRFPAEPEIPTVEEAGVLGLYYISWSRFWAPKRTPNEVITRLAGAVVDGLADPVSDLDLRNMALSPFHANSRRPKHLPHRREPRSRNSGRSSRQRTASRSKTSC